MRSDREKKLTHGTLDGYSKHRCRCKKCTEVWELYTQEYREEVFDETKARRKPLRIPLSSEDYSERRKRWR